MKPSNLGTLIYFVFLFSLLSLSIYPAKQQAQEKNLTSDELFAKARTLANEGKRQQARDISIVILEKKPGYHGVRILLGFGSSPVEIFYLEDIERLNSFKLGFEVKREFSPSLVVKFSARFEREEYIRDKFGNRFTLSIRLEERIFRKY